MAIICTIDQSLVKRCIEILGGQNNIKLLDSIQKFKPDTPVVGELLIIDLETCDEKNIPNVECSAVVLAMIPSYKQAMRLLKKGFRGYGNKHMKPENLLQVLIAVQAGQVWLPPDIINQMITAFPHPDSPNNDIELIEPLSKREEEVVYWVTRGLSNKEMAEKMNITIRTVKAHLTSIFGKTGFRDRLELAIKMKNK